MHIRDNLELNPFFYRIALNGVEIAGEARSGQSLGITPGMVTGTLPGAVTSDPASGLPGTWIDTALRDEARAMGYTVVDADTVVAMYLNHLITLHAAELQQLIDHLDKESPKLTLEKVLQNLLAEGIHIHDMRTIVETMAENASHHQVAGAAGARPAARRASRFLRRSLPQLKLLSHADTGLEEHQGDGAGGWAGVRAGSCRGVEIVRVSGSKRQIMDLLSRHINAGSPTSAAVPKALEQNACALH